MSTYNKLWGNLIGAVAGLGVAYGLVPADVGSQVTTAATVLIPIIFGLFGTYISPKNKY